MEIGVRECVRARARYLHSLTHSLTHSLADSLRYLVRFDFGPHRRLNEIEIFPDLFGGTVPVHVCWQQV